MNTPGAIDEQEAEGNALQEERDGDIGTEGIAAPAEQLPHLDAIQQSFGRYDVSGVEAHTGAQATAANEALGASGYTMGNHVAFSSAPDLHTAAHEATHVIQQRAGVQLLGGMGQVGDKYEQHADAVAEQVAQGRSSEDLLAAYAGAADTKVGPNDRDGTARQQALDGGGEHIESEGENARYSPVTQRKIASAGGVIQMSPQTTHFGRFIDTTYNKTSTGVEMHVEFEPGNVVDAKKIGMVQSVRTLGDGNPIIIDPSQESRFVTSGPGAGYRTDRVTSKNNPIYGAESLGYVIDADGVALNDDVPGPWRYSDRLPKGTRVVTTGQTTTVSDPVTVVMKWVNVIDGPSTGASGYVPETVLKQRLADTETTNARTGSTPSPTNATYELGHRYDDSGTLKQKNAWLYDVPTRAASPNSSMTFETTALAIEGAQQGTYYGSVKWGWERGADNVLKKIDFAVVSQGTPSQNFLAPAAAWNTATTRGTLVARNNSTQVYKMTGSAFVPDFTINQGTKLTTSGSIGGGGVEYRIVSVVDGIKAGSSGYIKVPDILDQGDGPPTVDLPVPDVHVVDADGVALNDGVPGPWRYSDRLPKGTRVVTTGQTRTVSDPVTVVMKWVNVVDGPSTGASGFVPETVLKKERP